MIKRSFYIILVCVLFVGSCKKEPHIQQQLDSEVKRNWNFLLTQSNQPIYGSFTTSRVDFKSPGYSDVINTALAWFGYCDSFSFPTHLDYGGNVLCQNNLLSVDTNNHYQFNDFLGALGIPSDSISWSVDGDSINGIDAFSAIDLQHFPPYPGIVDVDTILSAQQSLTLYAETSVNAEYIIFALFVNGGNNVAISMPANTTSATFQPSDLSFLLNGSTSAQIAVEVISANYHTMTFNGREYAFCKQSTSTKYYATLNQ